MNNTTNITIILADDHELYRDGFARLFSKCKGIELVALASNGDQLLRLTRLHRPDVILTDIRMPVMTGLEAARVIRKVFPEIPVIALTAFNDDRNIIRMLQAGVAGYLSKEARKDEIPEAVRQVAAGGTYYCSDTAPRIQRLAASGIFDLRTKTLVETFNPTEKRLIHYLCEEYTNQEIADAMGMTKRAVEGCRARIMAKMNVKNLAGLILYAYKYALHSPGEIVVG